MQFYSQLFWLKYQDISSVFSSNLIRFTINPKLVMACLGCITVKPVETVPLFY